MRKGSPVPDESDLRNLFETSSAPSTLDVDRIIAKSRARRLPRQIGAGLIGTLAVAGIFVLAVQPQQLAQPPAASMTESQEAAGGAAADNAIKRAPAEKLNLCGGTLAEVAPSFYGLQLDVAFPATAPAGPAPIEGTVTLTNTGTTRVSGSTAATPAITLSQSGTVLWHSNGPMIMSLVIVDLAPGESLRYPASFTAVRCGVEDDAAEVFRADLPALPAGDYELSAAIDFSADPSMATNGTPDLDLVTGPRNPVTLTQ